MWHSRLFWETPGLTAWCTLKKINTPFRITLLPEPPIHSKSLCLSSWQWELKDDPDREFLLQGIRDGFHIVDASVTVKESHMYNYRSATNPDTRPKAEAQILEEIKEDHYVVSPDRLTLTSAIGAIPKKNSESVRLIHDCSQPSGTAVNDYAPLGPKLRYHSVDDAVKLMRPHGYSAKIDLRSAYRSVKIHPSNYEFTGLSWQFEGHDEPIFLYDTRLPFGSKLSPGIFHRLTQAVRRMMARRNYEIVAYLDDFFIHAATQAECAAIQRTLVSLLQVLGFAISWNKIEGPSKRITFLGIAIDSESFTIELPEGKLVEFDAMLQQFAGNKRATLRQLQQLVGRLNWACQVVRGGRSYLRRILDLMKPLKRPHHQARLSHEFQADVSWWLQFLSFFNGKCIALNCAPVHDVYLDASNLGAGYVFASDWAILTGKSICRRHVTCTLTIKKYSLQYWQLGAGPHCGLILESYSTQII